jgi:hypothetical protein
MNKSKSIAIIKIGVDLTTLTGTGLSGGISGGGVVSSVTVGSLNRIHKLTTTAIPIRIRAITAVRLIRGLDRLERAK